MKKVFNEFDPFLNECQTYVWEWYIPEQKVRFGIPSLNTQWETDQEKNVKLATMLERVHPDDIQKVLVGRNSPLFKSDKMFEVDLRLNVAAVLTPDGKESGNYEWYGFRGQTITRDAKGRPSYVRGVAINVDWRYRAQSKLLAAKDRLIQREKLKQEYSMGAIQELDQFFQTLATNADSIINGEEDFSNREQRLLMLNGLKEQITHILELTDRMKQLSGGSFSDNSQDIKHIPLWEHLAELQQILSLKLSQKRKIYLSNSYDNVSIDVNVKLFDVLLENVLKAQIHNTKTGYLTIHYQVYEEDKLRITVSCTENETQRRNLDFALTESGMALSVCRLLAKRLWGEIEVPQTDGNQLMYVITMPINIHMFRPLSRTKLEISEGIVQNLEQEVSSADSNSDAKGMVNVLGGIMSSTELLQETGLFNLQLANDTDTVKMLFEQNNPDIVFVDYNLPGLYQIDELISYMHSLHPETPIIVTAQYATRVLHHRIQDDGANYLLSNPLTLRKVNVMIKKYLK